MIKWKQLVQKLRRFDVETTYKNPRGELIDILSILKIESTWNFHVESMANRRRCVHWDVNLKKTL